MAEILRERIETRMIKGVNKRIVEVNLPDSEHFEKAVVFLRGDIPPAGELRTAQEARENILALENGLCRGRVSPRRARLRFGLLRALEIMFRLSVIICAAAAVCLMAGYINGAFSIA